MSNAEHKITYLVTVTLTQTHSQNSYDRVQLRWRWYFDIWYKWRCVFANANYKFHWIFHMKIVICIQVITMNPTVSTHSTHWALNVSSTEHRTQFSNPFTQCASFIWLGLSFNRFHMIRCRSLFVFVEDTFLIAIHYSNRFDVFSQVLFLFYCCYSVQILRFNQIDTKRIRDVMTPMKSILQRDAMQGSGLDPLFYMLEFMDWY